MPPKLNIPIQENVPLAPLTTWKVGGPARWLAQPSISEAPELYAWARKEGIPIYLLGRGSNVLIPDQGLFGLVVLTKASMAHVEIKDNLLVAEGGGFLAKVSNVASRAGWAGFEFLVGIPGTVGGAIVINAGLTVYRPREMTAIVKDFDVLFTDGRVETLTYNNIHAGYRCSDLLGQSHIVLSARFRLDEQEDSKVIRKRTVEHLKERKSKQPLDKPTAGSTFKSVPEGKGAGWYIEQAGLKGFQIGGARVSPKHANWIENMGGAKASDIRQLIAYIQDQVDKKCGVFLEPEPVFLK
jgi:UDP-N-acetylmuramate dehydrogenase